jgi:hypothetical protein
MVAVDSRPAGVRKIIAAGCNPLIGGAQDHSSSAHLVDQLFYTRCLLLSIKLKKKMLNKVAV